MSAEDYLMSDNEVYAMLKDAIRDHIYFYADAETTKDQIELEVLDTIKDLKPESARRAFFIKLRDAPLRKLSIIDVIEIVKREQKEDELLVEWESKNG